MDKNLTIKDKILYFIENQGIKKTEFFKKTQISASNFKGAGLNSELGGDKIVKILSEYSMLSAEWLLRNEGGMLRCEEISNHDTRKNQCYSCEEKDKMIDILRSLLESYFRECGIYIRERESPKNTANSG